MGSPGVIAFMPGMSGFYLARDLQRIRPDIPIIISSGYIRPEDRAAAQYLSIRDLILKPYTTKIV